MRMALVIGTVLGGLTLTPIGTQAQSPASIDRAIRAEAARLAASGAAGNGSLPAVEQDRAGLSAWTSVAGLDAGSEILIVRAGVSSPRSRLLSVQDDSLTILDASSPIIPSAVASRLRRDARIRPGVFLDARGGREVALTNRISIGPSGVSDQGRPLFPLSLVVIDVPRSDVEEVRVIRKHVGRHAKRGMVIGAVVGTVVVGAATLSATCSGTDCGNPAQWIAMGALGGSLAGLEYGTIIGLIAPRSPDVVYRR